MRCASEFLNEPDLSGQTWDNSIFFCLVTSFIAAVYVVAHIGRERY